MSDHEATAEVTFTPDEELDDHRNQSVSTPRVDRQRRGTFDTLYGARQPDNEPGSAPQPDPTHLSVDMHNIRVRDFEEAVVDDEFGDPSATPRRSRRPTVETQRTSSPPNSVKAFAEARRRERDLSFSEARGDRKGEDDGLSRAMSVASHRSHRSRPHTAVDTESIATSDHIAKEDVCYPLQDDRRAGGLRIDFDYLEDFINKDRISQAQSRKDGSIRVFPDLRPTTTAGSRPVSAQFSISGDMLGVAPGMEKRAASDTDSEPVKDSTRISFFSSEWESTIHATELGDLVLPGEDIRGLFTLPQDGGDGVWWLNLNNPSKDEVYAICKAFGVHPLTLEDIMTQEAREKIELFPSYYFACFRSFNAVQEDDGLEYEPFNIYAVVFREGTLSFTYSPNNHASNVRTRIALLKDFVALSSDWICYALIDDIVDSFAPVIRRIELEVDAIEDSVFMVREADSSEFLKSVGLARKNINALMRLLGGKADVLKGFTKRCNENYKVTPRMDIGLYLGDIQDHVITMMTNLSHFENMLSRVHSNYLAHLSINSISQGTETNKALSKITFLGSMLLPLNLISGTFGMNVHVPFQGIESLAPFFGILGCMAFVCITCLLIARRYKYI